MGSLFTLCAYVPSGFCKKKKKKKNQSFTSQINRVAVKDQADVIMSFCYCQQTP